MIFRGVASPFPGFRASGVISNLSLATSCDNYTRRLKTKKMAAGSTTEKVFLRCFWSGFTKNLENEYKKDGAISNHDQ